MRTDLLRVCIPCRLRFEVGRTTCPTCGGSELCAAADADRRWRERPRPMMRRWFVWAIGPVTAWLAIACWLGVRFAWSKMVGGDEDAGLPFQIFTVFLGICFGLLSGFLLLLAVLAGVGFASEPRQEPPPLKLAVRGAPAVERWIAGRVARASGKEVEAPVSGDPCVAFRVVGSAGGHAIDDGGAAPFEVEMEGAEIVLVQPEAACVDLVVGAPLGPRHVGGRLGELVGPRGIPAGVAARIAEAVLRVGDSVEVGGTPGELLAPGDGYRDSKLVRVLRSSPASPVVIRAGRCGPQRA